MKITAQQQQILLSKRKPFSFFFLKRFHSCHTASLLKSSFYLELCAYIVALWGIFLNNIYFPLICGYLASLSPGLYFYSRNIKLNNRKRTTGDVLNIALDMELNACFSSLKILRPIHSSNSVFVTYSSTYIFKKLIYQIN